MITCNKDSWILLSRSCLSYTEVQYMYVYAYEQNSSISVVQETNTKKYAQYSVFFVQM